MKNKVVSLRKRSERRILLKYGSLIKKQTLNLLYSRSITQGNTELDSEVFYFGKTYFVPVKDLPDGIEKVKERALNELIQSKIEISDRIYSPVTFSSWIVIKHSSIETYETVDIDLNGIWVTVRVPYKQKK